MLPNKEHEIKKADKVIKFKSLNKAIKFARKLESECETRFAGNFADPNWVCIGEGERTYYNPNTSDTVWEFRTYKIVQSQAV